MSNAKKYAFLLVAVLMFSSFALTTPKLMVAYKMLPPQPSDPKRMDLYSSSEVFIITDDHWEDVANLVPVTTWTWAGTIKKYPTMILYTEDGSLPRNYAWTGSGATASATATWEGHDPNFAIDGLTSSSWNSGSEADANLTINFGQVRTIDEIRLIGCDLYPFRLYRSTNGASYTQFWSGQMASGWNQIIIEDWPIQARYLKIELLDPPSHPEQWKCMNEVRAYNHNDLVTERFDADSIIHFLQMYHPQHVTLVGDTPTTFDDLLTLPEPMGAGMEEGEISRIFPHDYYSYWAMISTVVYSDHDYSNALMASTYASLRNMPLVIDGQEVFPLHIFEGRNVILVGDVPCPPEAASCTNHTLESLQRDYIARTGTDKLLMVNPLDKDGVGLEREFYTDKCGAPIMDIFQKNSLAAPFLAAGKHEFLAFNDVPISPDVPDAPSSEMDANVQATNEFVDSTMESFFNNSAKYLTIFASPKAIPDSLYTEPGLRDPIDWGYALKPYPYIVPSNWFPIFKLQVGRIYGISTSDASSYVARSLFYDSLMNGLYEGDYTGFDIGTECHGDDPATNARNARNHLLNLGYTAACSAHVQVGCERENPTWFSDADTALLQGRQFLSFEDHGSPTAWSNAVESAQLPYMSLPVAIGGACSTSNFGVGKENTFSSSMLRKGAMAYYGAVGMTYAGSLGSQIAKVFTQRSPNNNVGELGEYSALMQSYRTTVGDPTLAYRKVITNNMTTQCNDGIDNDNDGQIDQQECSCASSPFNPGEGLNPQCNDGIDNDGDGLVDLQDPVCQLYACSYTEYIPGSGECTDGIDNDNDGDVDLRDPACVIVHSNGQITINTVEGPACDDNIDNDGDGTIDWDGAGMGEPDASCLWEPYGNTELTECDDGIDNDNDGDVDWDGAGVGAADPACLEWPDYNEGPECDDSINNDNDSGIDWDGAGTGVPDRACANSPRGALGEGPQCDDGIDNDGDGAVDFPADAGCKTFLGNNEGTQCDDGIDNDNDSGIDWDGAGVGEPDAACAHGYDNLEGTQCDDGIDNDNDSDIDWDGAGAPSKLPDPACAHAHDNLEGTQCDDNIDNDGDGSYDWNGIPGSLDGYPLDPGCGNNPLSIEGPECDDNIDNDFDALIDWDGAGVGQPDDGCVGNATDNSEGGWPTVPKYWSPVSPADIQMLAIAQASFGDGERIYFNYTIVSRNDTNLTFTPYIVCENNPAAYLVPETVSLQAYEEYVGTYYDFVVGERTQPGTCTATVKIEGLPEHMEKKVTTAFSINTMPAIETRFMTCADEECATQKKVFLEGETVYVKGTAKNGKPLVVQSNDATFSNGMASVVAVAGSRAISVTSSHPAYKSERTEKVQYAVLPQHVQAAIRHIEPASEEPNFQIREVNRASSANTLERR